MKIKPASQSGHVTLDLGTRDTRLLAGGWETSTVDPRGIEAATTRETSFAERLNERANKRTRLLEDILTIHAPPGRWGINE